MSTAVAAGAAACRRGTPCPVPAKGVASRRAGEGGAAACR